MKNPEMKVIRFAAEDVIATSAPAAYRHYTTIGHELHQEGTMEWGNPEYYNDLYHFYIYDNQSESPYYEGERGPYAWYEQGTGTWKSEEKFVSEYAGKLPNGEGGYYTYGG